MIPLGEKHLRRILSEWVTHYNQGRPHLSLGPGIPERAAVFPPRCKITTNIPSPKTAKSRLARFSAASITNTGGKGSRRETRTAQKAHGLDTAFSRMTDDCRAGAASGNCCLRGTRWHATPHATTDSLRGRRRAEFVQFLVWQTVSRNREERSCGKNSLVHFCPRFVSTTVSSPTLVHLTQSAPPDCHWSAQGHEREPWCHARIATQ